MSASKMCTKCRAEKPIEQFPIRRDRGNRPRSHCIPCHNAHASTPHSKALQRRARYARKYGITVEEFDAMLAAQGGRCAICTDELTPETWHVDHDHATGRVRKVLCAHCNRGLGMFMDDPDRLTAAAEYLLKHREVDAPCP